MIPERVIQKMFGLAQREGRCLIVKGLSPRPNGYLALGWRDGGDQRKEYVHRIAYISYYGALPDPGMVVAHTCDNRRCIEREHLVAVTQARNLADMVAKGRSNRGERHWNWKGGASKNYRRGSNRLHGAEPIDDQPA